MSIDPHIRASWSHFAGGLGVLAATSGRGPIWETGFNHWSEAVPWILSVFGVILGGLAIVFAVRARQVAHSALQEAGEAKARAQASGPFLSTDALAATERVWTARLNAIESQLQSNLSRVARTVAQDRQPSSDLSGRIEEIEKAVQGLSAAVAQSRRAPAVSAVAPVHELQWPAVLKTEKQGLKELRDLLQEGARIAPGEWDTLCQTLKAAEAWSPKRLPALEELLSFLAAVSQSFYTMLRKGALLPAHEASRMSDRLAALLRPMWQKFHPEIDCRIFYPGAPFDPEWMEDQNPAGLQRPTISDIFSWAVHEKHASGRRIIAKSRVTTE